MPNDWRTGYRVEEVEYRLLTLDLSPAGTLDGVESCSISGSVNADVRWGGSMTWSGQAMIDWSQVLVHPWYLVDGNEYPVCPPMFVKAPQIDYSSTVPQTINLSLYDVTYKLAKRLKLTSYLTIAPGVNIASALASRLAATGLRYSILENAATLSSALNFEPGDSEMLVQNALLGAMNYWSVHSDYRGVVQGEPWQDSRDRAVDWDFVRGSASIIQPNTSVTLDDFDVPNRLTGIPRVDGDTTPVPQTVTLDDVYPESPYTYANRGFWVDGETMRDVDAADAATLVSILTRKLLSQASAGTTRSVRHAWIPEVTLGSLVTYPGVKDTEFYTVQKMDADLKVGGLPVRAEWRKVS